MTIKSGSVAVFVLVLAAVALTTAGCGKRSATAQPISPAARDAAAAAAVKGFATPKNCQRFNQLAISFVQAVSRSNVALVRTRNALRKFLDTGPPEVRADFTVLAASCGLQTLDYVFSVFNYWSDEAPVTAPGRV